MWVRFPVLPHPLILSFLISYPCFGLSAMSRSARFRLSPIHLPTSLCSTPVRRLRVAPIDALTPALLSLARGIPIHGDNMKSFCRFCVQPPMSSHVLFRSRLLLPRSGSCLDSFPVCFRTVLSFGFAARDSGLAKTASRMRLSSRSTTTASLALHPALPANAVTVRLSTQSSVWLRVFSPPLQMCSWGGTTRPAARRLDAHGSLRGCECVAAGPRRRRRRAAALHCARRSRTSALVSSARNSWLQPKCVACTHDQNDARLQPPTPRPVVP